MALKKTKNLDTITNQKLSIQISLSGLSFCILNINTNTFENFEYIPFNKKVNPFVALERLMHYFDTREYLQKTFNDILVIHENDLSTLVPKPLFNKDYLADYLKFNSKILKSDYINYDTLDNNESVNVYVPYVNINNFIYDAFGEFTFKHFSTILIDEILKNEKNSSVNKVYVHVSEQHFEIVAVNSGKLKLYNTFEYKNAEDFIYYLLFTLEQLNYNPEHINVVLIGNISKDDSLYKMAYTYIRNISFGVSRNRLINDTESNHSNYIIAHSF
ncbi:uncharacterized protein DUF3822 [Jejuia pallidilutea]|uniref:Uncharacterized protein DUF3822 n=1 Tax=Jejuia pallidilutea TaxID=504487 RepID=A0A362WXE2_9FLAO|nr:DUF3822 family protein [Jejuia pallidilutea]PQV46219.1 uncharacterized protein DUF3822 [Jejuia pallidilutea]